METPITRRERERLSRRQAMLDAARDVFAEKGFRGATLDEIAHRAEFGKGTLYNYFEGGKDEMLLAIVDDFYDDMCRITRASFSSSAMASATFGECLNAHLQTVIAYFKRSQELFMIVMKETGRMLLSDDREKALHLRNQHNRIIDYMMPAIDLAIERSELKPRSSYLLAHVILGNLDGFLRFSCWHEVGKQERDVPTRHSGDKAALFLSSILIDGMGAGNRSFDTDSGHAINDIPTNGS